METQPEYEWKPDPRIEEEVIVKEVNIYKPVEITRKFKRTKLDKPLRGRPLDIHDMILRCAEIEDIMRPSEVARPAVRPLEEVNAQYLAENPPKRVTLWGIIEWVRKEGRGFIHP